MVLGAIVDPSNAAPKPTKGKKTVEETYQKLTQHEHILQRPDTYVGSIEVNTHEMWCMDPDEGRMKQQKMSYVPGLYKIFDEILVNAADNKQRDSTMNELKVDIDRETGRISVYNNGKGIPVVVHKEHGIYVPELIFGASRPPVLVRPSRPQCNASAPLPHRLTTCAGHLLTSSNYDDSQKKVTGGRNGYGAPPPHWRPLACASPPRSSDHRRGCGWRRCQVG
eukprot:scaffold16436_cov67-Phaeocystis_antarctica.AAC.2